MAVATWDRGESKAQYIHNIYELEKDCLQFVMNSPSKYRNNISDFIVKSCMSALEDAVTANNLYPMYDQQTLLARQYKLISAKSKVKNVCTQLTIWTEMMRSSDNLTQQKLDKINKRLERIGTHSVKCVKTIDGLIKSDIERWNHSHPHNRIEVADRDLIDVVIKQVSNIFNLNRTDH